MKIETEEAYEAAIKRIDEIFDAVPETSEEDELEILVAAVDAYEEENFPIGLPDPIEAIKIRAEDLGISLDDLYLNPEILERTAPITESEIIYLSEKLGLPIEILSQLEVVKED